MTDSGQGSFILASASPRRQELLRSAGLTFTVTPAHIDESALPGEPPEAHVLRLAREKAEAVACQSPGALVLGADTVVVLGETIFGKPASLTDAEQVLARLSGKSHNVLTGVCLRRVQPAHCDVWCSRTRVYFRELSSDLIRRYCALVNTLDKAGAYAIQEHGDMIVSHIEGLRTNVIGLPLEDVVSRLDHLMGRRD